MFYCEQMARHHFHYVLVGGKGRAVTVELHFGLPAHHQEHRLIPETQMSWFRKNTRTFFPDPQTPCLCPSPEAHLLYLSAHHILQHGHRPVLLRDLDLHLLIEKENPDWTIIIDQAAVLGWTGAIARALERANEFFATPVPKNVLEELVHRRPAHEDPLLVEKKQTAGHRWRNVSWIESI